jgi:ankyrin repeat protein
MSDASPLFAHYVGKFSSETDVICESVSPLMRPVEEKTIAQIDKIADNPKQLKRLLCEASSKGWCEVVRALLARDVSPEAREDGLTALTIAARFGNDNTDVVRILLDAGASPKVPGVMEYCGVQSLPLLLAAGGNVDGHPKGKNPLLVAIVERTKQDKAAALISAGANPNVADSAGMTPLMFSMLYGRDEVFEALIAAGADVHAVDATGRSALRHGLETLCDATGATASDGRRTRSLVRALAEGLPAQPEDLVLLDIVLGDHRSLAKRLNDGLDANTVISGSIGALGVSRETLDDQLKKTGLIDAVVHGFFLLDPESVDSIAGGSPLLMWAVAAKQARCIELLLSHGADAEQLNNDGVSAFTLSNSPRYGGKIRKLIRNAIECK